MPPNSKPADASSAVVRAYAPREMMFSISHGSTEAAYQRQYAGVYDTRLGALRQRCWDAAPKDALAVERVLDLKEDVRSMVVGTLVKEAATPDEPPMRKDSYCRESDCVFLEDQGGRMMLEMKGEEKHQFCTGMVVGVVGEINDLGKFRVAQVVFPASLPHPITGGDDGTKTDHGEERKGSPHKILFISGLQCGDPDVSPVPREMLFAYLQGHFTQSARDICRVVIAGGGPSARDTLDGVRALDAWLAGLIHVTGLPVDVLPGKTDPTTANWPQRPLHESLFRHTKVSHLLGRAPNPYAAHIMGRYLVGTGGENVADLCKSIMLPAERNAKIVEARMDVEIDEEKKEETAQAPAAPSMAPPTELEALERTLRWGHVCPTGPATVPTVPHLEEDPMLISDTPHIYFCGSCTAPESTLVRLNDDEDVQTLIVCVPSFAKTGKALLVDLDSLGVDILHFQDGTSS